MLHNLIRKDYCILLTCQHLWVSLSISGAFLIAQLVKNLPAMRETWVRSLSWEDPLEKGRATHSSILAWRIPWTIQSDMTECLSLHFTSLHFTINPWVGKIPWSRKWQPTPVFLPGKLHGKRSLEGQHPWSCKESDTSKPLNTHIHMQALSEYQLHCHLYQLWRNTDVAYETLLKTC